MTIEEILALKRNWREQSIYAWPNYLEKGGKIYPVSILKEIIHEDKWKINYDFVLLYILYLKQDLLLKYLDQNFGILLFWNL